MKKRYADRRWTAAARHRSIWGIAFNFPSLRGSARRVAASRGGRGALRLERIERALVFGQRLRRHGGAAFVAGVAHAVEPAAAALVAGEFRGAARIEKNHL